MRAFIALTLVRAASALVSLAVRVQRPVGVVLLDDLDEDMIERLGWTESTWRGTSC